MNARATPAVFSGRRETSRPPRSVKEYISLWTMSDASPTLLTKSSVGSREGVRISS